MRSPFSQKKSSSKTVTPHLSSPYSDSLECHPPYHYLQSKRYSPYTSPSTSRCSNVDFNSPRPSLRRVQPSSNCLFHLSASPKTPTRNYLHAISDTTQPPLRIATSYRSCYEHTRRYRHRFHRKHLHDQSLSSSNGQSIELVESCTETESLLDLGPG